MRGVSSEVVLQMQNLGLARGRKRLAEGLSLSLSKGERSLVVGGNGSGKTTLSWVLLGLLPKSGGELTRPQRIGFAPQDPRFPLELRVEAYLRQLGALQGWSSSAAQQAAARTMERFQLQSLAKERIGTLSRGWQQRVNLARAWLGEPPLLLLDEAQTALDPEGMQSLQAALEEADAPTALLLAPPHVGCESLAPIGLTLSGHAGLPTFRGEES